MTHPFTPTYIAMARAAEEIQAMRPMKERFEDGDWALTDEVEVAAEVEGGILTRYDGIVQAWLPRLDQLLGMLGSPDFFMGLAEDFNHDWVEHFENERDDWHELALAVLMKEKHGKQWRKGEWVKT